MSDQLQNIVVSLIDQIDQLDLEFNLFSVFDAAIIKCVAPGTFRLIIKGKEVDISNLRELNEAPTVFEFVLDAWKTEQPRSNEEIKTVNEFIKLAHSCLAKKGLTGHTAAAGIHLNDGQVLKITKSLNANTDDVIVDAYVSVGADTSPNMGR